MNNHIEAVVTALKARGGSEEIRTLAKALNMPVNTLVRMADVANFADVFPILRRGKRICLAGAESGVQLDKNCKKVLELLQLEPQSMSQLEAVMNKTTRQIATILKKIQTRIPGTRFETVGGLVTIRRIESKLVRPVATAEPLPVGQISVEATAPLTIEAVAGIGTVINVKATQIVWPEFPALVDLDKEYPFFLEPEWFTRLISKVTIHHKHILIAGPPGIGKSSAFEVLAARCRIPLVNINAEGGLRARSMVGSIQDLGTYQVAQFIMAAVRGAWAKIDEANAAEADVMVFLNSLLAPPRRVTINGVAYNVHPDFRLCLTYNPGLVGTKPLPDSLKDRLYPFKVPFPTEAVLRKMLKANGVEMEVPEAERMIEFAMQVANLTAHQGIRYNITLRRLLDAWTDILDGASLYDALMNSVVAGIDSTLDMNKVAEIVNRYR